MALLLNEETIASYKSLWGADTINVSSGKVLTIETSPNGEEILVIEVPEGKAWEVIVSVSIKETNT